MSIKALTVNQFSATTGHSGLVFFKTVFTVHLPPVHLLHFVQEAVEAVLDVRAGYLHHMERGGHRSEGDLCKY